LGALGCGREQLEKRLVEEETAKRVDAAVAARVEEELKSERVQKLIQDKVDAARKQMESDMMEELEREKRRMIDDMRTKEVALPFLSRTGRPATHPPEVWDASYTLCLGC